MEKNIESVKGGKVTFVAEETKFAKLKGSLKKNGKRIAALGLTVAVIGGALALRLTNKDKSKENDANSSNAETNIETKKEETYSRELLVKRISEFTKTSEQKGLALSQQEVRDLSILMNIDKIVSEDSELAKELFDGKNAQDILSDVGHTIGKLMTNSMTKNYKETMNLSDLVVGNDYDKDILICLEAYRDELTKMRAEEVGEHRTEFATKEEEEKFNQIITDVLNFYSMTADGLEIDGKNVVIQPMGDGNRFAMVLVMNEIALGNRNLLSDEQYKAFEKLTTNEPVVANLHRIIDGCQTVEVETEKTLTK